jgi:hypothetical protein
MAKLLGDPYQNLKPTRITRESIVRAENRQDQPTPANI